MSFALKDETYVRDVISTTFHDPVLEIQWVIGGLRGQVAVVSLHNQKVVVKLASEAWIRDQLPHYHSLSRFIDEPKVIASGDTYLIMEYIEGMTLESLIKSERESKNFSSALDNILVQLKFLWEKTITREPCFARGGVLNPPWKILQEKFQDRLSKEIIINNRISPLRLEDCCKILEDGFKRIAPYSCLTHGDPRPDNLLVRLHENKTCFVDWRDGYLDWAHDLACLTKQRFFYTADFHSPITSEVKGNYWEISYEALFSSRAFEAERTAWENGMRFAEDIGDNRAKRRILLYMASPWIVEVINDPIRAQRGIIKLLPNFEAFCIAQAIECLEQINCVDS